MDEAIREHQNFFWELIGTDTVDHVSMQAGAGVWGDGLFFVPFQQRTAYTKINFRRSAGISGYEQVREIERQYVEVGQQIVGLLQGADGPRLLQDDEPGGSKLVLAILTVFLGGLVLLMTVVGLARGADPDGIAPVLVLPVFLGVICAGCIVARRSEISNWQQQRARLLALVEQRRGLIAGNQGLLNVV